MFEESKYNNKMSKTYEVFQSELSSLRTGRANAAMLDIVKVDVYGQKMPINQLGSITTPEPRSINIQVQDINNVTLIDSAIKKSAYQVSASTKQLQDAYGKIEDDALKVRTSMRQKLLDLFDFLKK